LYSASTRVVFELMLYLTMLACKQTHVEKIMCLFSWRGDRCSWCFIWRSSCYNCEHT